jgi:predicted acetyltransferase
VVGTRFDVLYEGASGSLDGFVCYGIKEKWGADGAHHQLSVRDFVATTPEATHALWRYVCEVDLIGTIRWYHLPLDSPLPWLLESARVMRAIGLDDYVWTRILDVPTSLGARRYAADGRVTFEVTDGFRPDGNAAGTFVLEGGPDGAEVRRADGGADLGCDVSALSAGWLGGVRWSELASAGLVTEREPGALARADAMFASFPLPYPFTWF